MDDPRQAIIEKLWADPVLAHETLFPHRHSEASQPFHHDLIKDWHSPLPRVLSLIFRDGGKSTIAEEAIVVMACLRKFNNGLIIGETETRAVERLTAIKHELENNEDIHSIFGDPVGPKWQETYIELANGAVLQAYGRGQRLRGVKHLHYRPDIAFLDDLEDEESVRTRESREKTLDWFVKTLLPALTPYPRVRMAATPLDNEALALQLAKLDSWRVRKIPISFVDPGTGEERSSWPQRYSMDWIREQREDYRRLGKWSVWMQEYMMEAENPEDKVFTRDMLTHAAIVRSWQPTFAVYDPARTVNKTSATTGKVVGSWIGPKLVIWEASAKLWRPDEIITDIFDTDEKYSPIAIGVEEDGLHEFIMQPLRHAQTERAHLVPIRPLKAPKGKIDFIKSLQPFFKAREIQFAGSPEAFDEMIAQLLSFPSGKIDAPNALAYFLRLRPGAPIYEDFSERNIQDPLPLAKRYPLYLVVNATRLVVVAALVQVYDGVLTVLADFAAEGDPGSALPSLLREAGATARAPFKVVVPKSHFEPWDQIGLRAAARRVPVDLQMGGDLLKGREEMRAALRRLSHGRASFRLSPAASWTLRALSGGYARDFGKDTPNEGVYRTLCEGLEAFAATLVSGMDASLDENVRYDYAPDGRRYITARATGR